MKMLEKTALRLFGGLTQPYLGYFDSLKMGLKRARMKQTTHEYVSLIVFETLLTFMASLIISVIFIGFVFPYPAYIFTLSIIISLVSSGGIFSFGYIYPSLISRGIRSKINKSLPFAAFYMTTSSSSGINPIEIFKVLSLRGGVIGEEAKKIYTNVKTFGMSLPTALQKSATASPSPVFADLLWGMVSVITAGGNLEDYLKGKTETLMAQYRRSLNDYSKSISLYTEIYITLVVIGSLFFIVLMAILSPMVGTNVLQLQTFLVFFFVPMISMGFIVLLRGMFPSE